MTRLERHITISAEDIQKVMPPIYFHRNCNRLRVHNNAVE
jgi:hypothetical protein